MSESINKLFASFDKYLPLDETECYELSARVVERKVRRKQFILQQDDVCKHYTFVAEGCFKKFHADKNGGEHNLHFAAENDWIMEINSFYSETPSHVYVEAMEPSAILQIKKTDLLHLFVNNPKFDRNFRVIAETRLQELENRVLQDISYTAEERYLYFISHYKHLLHRLPNMQIASYLGVTPEFLSKIRKNIAKSKTTVKLH